MFKPLIIREMQIKTTIRYRLALSELPSSKNPQTINDAEGVDEREHFCTVGGNLTRYSHYGREYRDSFKKIRIKEVYKH